MEDTIGKLLAIVVVITAIVFDWPRALAGLAVGYFGRRTSYAFIVIVIGVLAVAALGELIYPIVGRTSEPTVPSFVTGLVSAGATAYGVFRWLAGLLQS